MSSAARTSVVTGPRTIVLVDQIAALAPIAAPIVESREQGDRDRCRTVQTTELVREEHAGDHCQDDAGLGEHAGDAPGRGRGRSTSHAHHASVRLLWLTLGPAPWARPDIAEIPLGVLNPATWFSPVTWTTGSSVEFALNVMMFVPVGVLAALLLSGRTRIVLPVGFTVLIEVTQILLPERVSDPRGLVANSVGALAGLVLTGILAGQVRIPPGGRGAVVGSPS